MTSVDAAGVIVVSHRPKILIVDDEVDTCDNLSDIFTDIGYLVDTAHDGRTAVGLIEQNAYDVALLDLRMPGMGGSELYLHLKRISAGTRAIVVTAYASSDTARSVLEAGAWKLVPKPVDIQALIGLTNDAIQNPLVLLVDEDREFCEHLWGILGKHGYRVHLAYDVDDAKTNLRKHEFQVVLLPMNLPSEDGAKIMELIQHSNQQAQTLIITGFAKELSSPIEQTIVAGAEAACYSPVEMESLLANIEKIVKRE